VKKLLVIIPDRLSDLVKKGEITARYYNPGNVFDEVHILMTNDDRPDSTPLGQTVGHATLHLHNLPFPSPLKTLGWRPTLMTPWIKQGVNLASQIAPDLIRTHGNYLNGFLASKIKSQLGIPLVVSLHINPDVDLRPRTPWWPTWKLRLAYEWYRPFEKETLRNADIVLPVYEPARIYAEHRGARRIQVCYNFLNPTCLRKKESYDLHSPPRIISVGRLIEAKNPENLIHAIALLDDVELTIVGDGPIQERLQRLVSALGLSQRVVFRREIPNGQLCQSLADFDLFATHSEYWEISKAVLESFLTGLPTVLNRRSGPPVPELQGNWVLLVDNTVEGYYGALRHLLCDRNAREKLGQIAYDHAQEHFRPDKTEQAFVDIYRKFLPCD
jgi:glycosyltransferase involved in cell wall biosynthesis